MTNEALGKLVEQILAGNTAAFDELYRNTYKSVFFHAQKVLKNEQDAEDAVSEAYLRAYENLSRIKDPKLVQAWLNQTVTHISLNKIRDDRYRDAPSMDDEDFYYEPVAADSETPDKVLDQKSTEEIIGGMINQLPEVQRTTVILYYYDEMSVAQIAKEMGCSEGTVKSRLNYARKNIEVAVREEEKRGVKLYSVSPALLLAAIRRMIESSEVSSDSISGIAEQLARKGGYRLARHAAEAGSKAAAGKAVAAGRAAATAAATAKVGITTKIVTAAAAVLLVAGGAAGVTAIQHNAARQEPVAVEETMVPAVAPETSVPIITDPPTPTLESIQSETPMIEEGYRRYEGIWLREPDTGERLVIQFSDYADNDFFLWYSHINSNVKYPAPQLTLDLESQSSELVLLPWGLFDESLPPDRPHDYSIEGTIFFQEDGINLLLSKVSHPENFGLDMLSMYDGYEAMFTVRQPFPEQVDVLTLMQRPEIFVSIELEDTIPFNSNITSDSEVKEIDVSELSEETTSILTEDFFPDSVFLAKLQELFPNGLTKSEASLVRTLNLSGEKRNQDAPKIKDLSGIEMFSWLSDLNVDDNELTTLDVSGLHSLSNLYCERNDLYTLDVSNNPNLYHLHCSGNNLQELNLTKNPLLFQLWCDRNNLGTLDVSNNPDLWDLDCSRNELTTLDLSNNRNLEHLACDKNHIATLDLRNNIVLKYAELDQELENVTLYYKAGHYFSDMTKVVGSDNLNNVLDFNNGKYSMSSGIVDFGTLSPSTTLYEYRTSNRSYEPAENGIMGVLIKFSEIIELPADEIPAATERPIESSTGIYLPQISISPQNAQSAIYQAACKIVLDDFRAVMRSRLENAGNVDTQTSIPWYLWSGFRPEFVQDGYHGLCYAYYDFDSNGTEELIIAYAPEGKQKVKPLAIYAFDGERMQCVNYDYSAGERHFLYGGNGNSFCFYASEGAFASYYVNFHIAADGYSIEIDGQHDISPSDFRAPSDDTLPFLNYAKLLPEGEAEDTTISDMDARGLYIQYVQTQGFGETYNSLMKPIFALKDLNGDGVEEMLVIRWLKREHNGYPMDYKTAEAYTIRDGQVVLLGENAEMATGGPRWYVEWITVNGQVYLALTNTNSEGNGVYTTFELLDTNGLAHSHTLKVYSIYGASNASSITLDGNEIDTDMWPQISQSRQILLADMVIPQIGEQTPEGQMTYDEFVRLAN